MNLDSVVSRRYFLDIIGKGIGIGIFPNTIINALASQDIPERQAEIESIVKAELGNEAEKYHAKFVYDHYGTALQSVEQERETRVFGDTLNNRDWHAATVFDASDFGSNARSTIYFKPTAFENNGLERGEWLRIVILHEFSHAKAAYESIKVGNLKVDNSNYQSINKKVLEFVLESTAWLDVLRALMFGSRDQRTIYRVQQELKSVHETGTEIDKVIDRQNKNPDEPKALSDFDISLYRTQVRKNQQIASTFMYYSLSRH